MDKVSITLKHPIRQFVNHQSHERDIPTQEMVAELIALGFEQHLRERYQRYRQGEISLGRLAQDLGMTTWELSHLLEERNWPVHNLPDT
jgi:predicted HTH domain antitoxin